MSPKLLIKDFTKRAKQIREVTRQLNMDISTLNGVAARVPTEATYPLSYFKGHKVILHNVGFEDYGLTAVITIPYQKNMSEVRQYPCGKFRFCIDESWFNEEKE